MPWVTTAGSVRLSPVSPNISTLSASTLKSSVDGAGCCCDVMIGFMAAMNVMICQRKTHTHTHTHAPSETRQARYCHVHQLGGETIPHDSEEGSRDSDHAPCRANPRGELHTGWLCMSSPPHVQTQRMEQLIKQVAAKAKAKVRVSRDRHE